MQLLTEIWRNVWARLLILIFVAFEIYNGAILPAIRGTQDAIITQNKIPVSQADAQEAKMRLRPVDSGNMTNEQVRQLFCKTDGHGCPPK